MLNTPDIKQYIVEKFGGNESDWKRTNKTSTTFDDVKFIIRDFINTKTQFGISVINDEDSENGSIEDAKIYIDEKDWIFKIWVECDDLTDIGKESLSDVNYSIIFYEKDNDGDFDWHVGEYLHGFRLLSKDYEEVSENEFSYSGNSLLTLDDVKNDLIKPIMFNGKIHINGFIFDGFFN